MAEQQNLEQELPLEAETAEPVTAPEEEVFDFTAELSQARAEAEENKRKWYSVTAEYENYRKRTAQTRTQAYAEGRSDVVSKLFPIADNLYRAYDAAAEEKTKQGISMIIKSFEKLLEEESITVIDPLGEQFDVDKCEAIMAVDPAEGEESGTIKQVYLKGYEQKGKILRFAQVIVVK